MKSLIFFFVFGTALLGKAQIRHEGNADGLLLVGTHEWFAASGQKIAEVNYGPAGEVLGFKTWDEKGYLIDDERLPANRSKAELPEIELTFLENGFGFLIVHGHAEPDAPKANPGERVAVHYEGMLQDGTVFEETYSKKKPYRYKYGIGEVIAGFDEAVGMLKVGEEGYFLIPPDMGYGGEVMGMIPPFSTLLYRIKLVDLN